MASCAVCGGSGIAEGGICRFCSGKGQAKNGRREPKKKKQHPKMTANNRKHKSVNIAYSNQRALHLNIFEGAGFLSLITSIALYPLKLAAYILYSIIVTVIVVCYYIYNYIGDFILLRNSNSNSFDMHLLSEAINNADIGMIENFVRATSDVNFQDPSNGFTVLHYAAGACAHEIVDALLKHPEIDILIRDSKGRYPSELAFMEFGDDELAEYLLSLEAAERDRRGQSFRPELN